MRWKALFSLYCAFSPRRSLMWSRVYLKSKAAVSREQAKKKHRAFRLSCLDCRGKKVLQECVDIRILAERNRWIPKASAQRVTVFGCLRRR